MCKPTEQEPTSDEELQEATATIQDEAPSIDDQITAFLEDEITNDPMTHPLSTTQPNASLREAMGLMAIVYTLFNFKETDDIETEIKNNEHFAAAHIALSQMMAHSTATNERD